MNTPRWLFPFILALSFLMIGTSCTREESELQHAISAAASLPDQQERPQAKWLEFNDGLDKARSENKPIFVEFYTDWCVYCKKFLRETVQNQHVAAMLSENFVYVRLNAENSKNRVNFDGKSLSNVELTRAFDITAFPSLVFLDSTGQPITMLSGFVPARQFVSVLEYVHQKCYETQISFHEFAKKGNCN